VRRDAGRYRLQVRRRRLVAVSILVPQLALLGACQSDASRAAQAPTRANVARGWPKCGTFHPVTNVRPPVPLLGSGEVNYGWSTAYPSAISDGMTTTGTVVCIKWSEWGSTNAFGRGSGEIYGPNNTRPVVHVELHCVGPRSLRAPGHLSYTRLYLREPTTVGGKLGPWQPWAGTGRACS
jgi:hypothetical protein